MMHLCLDSMNGLSKTLSAAYKRSSPSVKPLSQEVKAVWRDNTLIKPNDTWPDFISAICKIWTNIRDECNVKTHMPYAGVEKSGMEMDGIHALRNGADMDEMTDFSREDLIATINETDMHGCRVEMGINSISRGTNSTKGDPNQGAAMSVSDLQHKLNALDVSNTKRHETLELAAKDVRQMTMESKV